MDGLQERLYTANMEEVYPVYLLDRPQQTFMRYRLSCFLMGYEEKMASYHYYLNKTGNTACTGTVEILTEPNSMNKW